jgi:type VI secretion system secreted protein VgrG
MLTFASLETPLADQLRLASMHSAESLSQPFVHAVTALSPRADLAFNDLLGRHATVVLAQSPTVSAEPRFHDGLVERMKFTGRQDGQYRYELELRPWFWFLSKTRDCKVFQNLTVVEIIEQVFADHEIAAYDVRTTASYTPWVYCVQYRESDFQFVSRLLEQEGITYHFEHARGRHVMVLTDSAVGRPECPGCHALAVRAGDAAGASRGDECVFDLSCGAGVRSGAVMLRDYDFTRSQLDLGQRTAQPAEHALGDLEVFDYPGCYDKEADGAHFAQAQIEQLAASSPFAAGRSDARGLACGGLMRIKGSPRSSDDAEYLVVGTRISITAPSREGGGSLGTGGSGSYACSFVSLPSAVPFRPPRNTRKPFVQGPQTAVVTGPAGEELHTDSYGRVKVQFHWDRYGQKNEKSSCWVRVASPWAGKNFGFMQVPRIGQEVIVDFLEGDPDQPIITGRVYNAQQMPPWELPANATQSGVLTRSSKGGAYGNANAIRFEDKAGSEQLWIHAEKNQDNEVENDETTSVGRDRTETVGRDETVTIGGNHVETVKMAKAETVFLAKALSIGLGYQTSVGAAMNTTVVLGQFAQIGLSKSTDVGKHYNITAGDSFSVTVGKARLTMSKDGKVTIVGSQFLFDASGPVQINGKDIDLN